MNTRIVSLSFILFFSLSTISSLFSQNDGLELKLQLLADGETWGVFVKPSNFIVPSRKQATGSGQVTIVAPVDFAYENLTCHVGTWVENARVNAPKEAPGKAYLSFGFEVETPKINLIAGGETLLFTFQAPDFEGQLFLIDNENDRFAQLPNSMYTNPGNDLKIVDFAVRGNMKTYSYAGNYQGEVEEEIFTMPAANNFNNQGASAQFVGSKED